MKISHLMNTEKEDIAQEIILSLLEDEDEWMKLRKRSTSTTLMYVALRNKIIDYIDKSMTSTDIARHSSKEVIQEIQNQLNNEDGNVWRMYSRLPKAEQDFVKTFYSKANEVSRTDLKHACRVTETQAARASRKILRVARLDITHRTLISFDQGELYV